MAIEIISDESSLPLKGSRKRTGPRSMFGAQHISTRASAPEYGFGQASRSDLAKVFLTQEHEKTNHGTVSPGPVYAIKSSLGKQETSTRLSSPTWGFGTSERFRNANAQSAPVETVVKVPKKRGVPGPGTYSRPSSFGKQQESTKFTAVENMFGSSTRDNSSRMFISHEHAKVNYGKCSPGPLIYNMRSSVGGQVSSKKPNLPRWAFPVEERFRYDYVDRAAKIPGAGQYNQTRACGAQIVSTKMSLPSFGFGSATRRDRDKVYVSSDHEKSRYGQQSPGPASVQLKSFMGPQINSRKLSSSQWTFGSTKRFKGNRGVGMAPGPGAYDP